MPERLSLSRVRQGDAHECFKWFEDWPDYAARGLQTTVDLPSERPDQLIYVGMGGSASAGDVINDWLNTSTSVESSIFKGFLPKRDLSRSLVLACSVSGNTSETLTMTRLALERGASPIVITGGGQMEALARDRGLPLVKLPFTMPPRFTFPFLLFSCLGIVERAFEVKRLHGDLRKSVKTMKDVRATVRVASPEKENPAKRLAGAVAGSVPLAYGSSVTRGVATRFKNQLNENAKMHALVEYAPELFHHEVESWDGPSEGFVPVIIRHKMELASERRRMDELVELLKERGVRVEQVHGVGETSLEQTVSLVYTLDFTTYYAAILLGRDPYPIPLIEMLKARLQQAQ